MPEETPTAQSPEQARAQRGRARAEAPAAPEVVVPDGVTPGVTPGWPVDGETGKPLALTDEQRAELAQTALTREAAEPQPREAGTFTFEKLVQRAEELLHVSPAVVAAALHDAQDVEHTLEEATEAVERFLKAEVE